MVDREEFLTADELARILRLSKATIYSRVRTRQLPCYRFGDRIVFRLAEVLSSARVPVEDDDFTNPKMVAAGGRR